VSLASRKLIQAAAGSAGGPSDDDFASVVLLLDGDGTSGDANNTFTDSSTNGYTVTESGSVVQGSFSPYNDNWSNYFDGVNDYLITETAAPAIGTDDFTIEFWYNGGAQPASYPCIIGTLDAFSATGAWRVQTHDNNVNRFQFTSAITNYIFTTTNYNDGVWRHFAVTREGTNLRGFVNGVQQGSTQTMSDSFTSIKILMMSQLRDGGDQEGYVSNARVVNGTALYTSDFTPPTAPLTAVTGTDFLSCQSNRFIDNSSNNFTLSVNSAPKVTPFSPFKDSNARDITTDGGSGYFGGSGDYLSAPSSVFSSPASTWTIEAWAYWDGGSKSGFHGVVGSWPNSGYNSNNSFVMENVNGTMYFYYIYGTSSGNGISMGTFNSHEWTHFKVIKTATQYFTYKNGVQQSSSSVGTNFKGTTNNVTVGGYILGDAGYWPGYITDVRIQSGGTSGNFTPPTSPLASDSSTYLLTNFQDAGIYDRSGLNNVDTVGNAQIDTAVKKYGTGSIQFDGTGDYLAYDDSSLAVGDGDFTAEGWVYWSSIAANDSVIFEARAANLSSTGWVLNIRSPNKVIRFFTGSVGYDGVTATTVNTWHHVAVTREGTTLRIFLDGNLDATHTVTNNFTDGQVKIGQGVYSSSDWNGHMDDLRITKGVARYTASFTPPTAALPKF